MSKVFMKYTSNINRTVTHCFPVIATFFLSLLFTISVVRYVSETQQFDEKKGFRVGTLFASR